MVPIRSILWLIISLSPSWVTADTGSTLTPVDPLKSVGPIAPVDSTPSNNGPGNKPSPNKSQGTTAKPKLQTVEPEWIDAGPPVRSQPPQDSVTSSTSSEDPVPGGHGRGAASGAGNDVGDFLKAMGNGPSVMGLQPQVPTTGAPPPEDNATPSDTDSSSALVRALINDVMNPDPKKNAPASAPGSVSGGGGASC